MNDIEIEVRQDRQEGFDLMQRITNGEMEAFEEFHRKYHVLIFTTIYKVLNNHEDSQDVTNEVLKTIWTKAANYRADRGTLVTWICTTARNRAIDRIRSIQRRSALYDRFEVKIDLESSDRSISGREDLYRSDARKVLQSAIVSLRAEQREVIELAYFEGLTQRQIAERLNRPLGTVKARIRRGVERLRDSFENEFDDEEKLLLLSSLG